MSLEEIAHLKRDVERLSRDLAAAKSQLSHSEMQIRTVINALPVGLFITDAEGRIEASNPYSLGLFRCGYQDLINRDIRELVRSEELSRVFGSGVNFEFCHRQALQAIKSDGDIFAAEVAVKPFLAVRGIKFVVIVEDVSARKRAQDTRDELFAMISHDFRSPLTSINISADILEKMVEQMASVQTDAYSTFKKPLQVVRNSSSRMLVLVNELLDLEKLQSTNFSFYFEPIWLNAVVDQAVEEVESIAQSRKVILEQKLANRRIIADRGRLMQLLVNLLSNAIKFAPDNSLVEIATQNFDHEILLTVTDAGFGIPEDSKVDIFEKFKQIPNKSASLAGNSGTGLGLPICKAIVEGHGGTIGVQNRESGGSVFWVRLPVRLEKE